MKKVLLALVLLCVLCVLTASALADNWDFVHKLIRVSTTSDLEALAAENGLSLSSWGDEGDYEILDFTLEGIPAYDANAYRYDSEPAYVGSFSFYASEGSTAEEPGQEFETLSAAMVSRYGEPDFSDTESDGISMSWYFEDASLICSWYAGEPAYIWLSYYGSSIMGDAKFPY